MTSSLHTRPIEDGDLAAARLLLAQLGYDLTLDETARRLGKVMSATDHAILVAEHDDRIAGLIHVYARPALDKPPEAIVQALVVDAVHRGCGIGKQLMRAAEGWASERGHPSVSLYSSVARDDAHAFYRGLGYALGATSHLCRRKVGDGADR